MSLTKTIQNAVNKAFNAAGDLNKVGVLRGPSITDYDLLLGEVVTKKVPTATVDIIVTQASKQDDSTTSYSAIVKSGIDLSVYKTIEIDRVTYKLGTYTDNSFVIEVTLLEE